MNDEREWKPLFSFGIDDGELDGLRPVDCFTLGYELALVREVYCNLPEGGCWPVHAENVERMQRALEESHRQWEMRWMQGDSSESWMQLTILPT